ncbi:hypothetical protein [Mycetohabitans endofungorum]|uniref:hypothetical protein n=1 Tax=Mycetohabitans endofungorum TaxID=417203 RepID=UPI00396A8155
MSWAESLPVFGSTYALGFGLCASLIVAIGAISASLVWFCALGYGARLLRPVFERKTSRGACSMC